MHGYTLYFCVVKPQILFKTKLESVSRSVKAATLKQQISKLYSQILSTEASFYIYDRPVTGINVVACFGA